MTQSYALSLGEPSDSIIKPEGSSKAHFIYKTVKPEKNSVHHCV